MEYQCSYDEHYKSEAKCDTCPTHCRLEINAEAWPTDDDLVLQHTQAINNNSTVYNNN